MEIAVPKYTVGQIVFGKLKGYPPWPAVVTGLPKGRNIANITYFNSGQCSSMSFKKLTPYHAANKIIGRYKNKNVGFTKALSEMELVAIKQKKIEKKKPNTQNFRIVVKLLSKSEILKIQNDLKKSAKERDGRCY